MVLEPSEARAFYDRFGKKQNAQAFYEEPVLKNLVDHAHFDAAKKVFEFGCGTGRFADHLLARNLRASATYLGCDLSPTMVRLAKQRLAAHAERAQVVQSDGIEYAFPIKGSESKKRLRMQLDLSTGLIIGAIVVNELLVGASLDQSIKQLSARRRIGVLAFSAYS
jgi:SAM-dependent methyltransferase